MNVSELDSVSETWSSGPRRRSRFARVRDNGSAIFIKDIINVRLRVNGCAARIGNRHRGIGKKPQPINVKRNPDVIGTKPNNATCHPFGVKLKPGPLGHVVDPAMRGMFYNSRGV